MPKADVMRKLCCASLFSARRGPRAVRPEPASRFSRCTNASPAARTILLAAIAVCVLADVRADAWGAAGHRVVSRAAVLALPSDVAPFVARQIDWIGSRSVLADSWRGPTEPFSKASEDPNHVWYLEQFAFLRQIPRSRDEFMLQVYDEHLRLRAIDPAK